MANHPKDEDLPLGIPVMRAGKLAEGVKFGKKTVLFGFKRRFFDLKSGQKADFKTTGLLTGNHGKQLILCMLLEVERVINGLPST